MANRKPTHQLHPVKPIATKLVVKVQGLEEADHVYYHDDILRRCFIVSERRGSIKVNILRVAEQFESVDDGAGENFLVLVMAEAHCHKSRDYDHQMQYYQALAGESIEHKHEGGIIKRHILDQWMLFYH